MEEEVRVVRSVECDSLSGKSKLKYEFGVLAEKGVQFRIVSNSGGGMFWKDWISMEEVIKVLASPDVSKAISATAFKVIFAGRSINTALCPFEWKLTCDQCRGQWRDRAVVAPPIPPPFPPAGRERVALCRQACRPKKPCPTSLWRALIAVRPRQGQALRVTCGQP